MGGTFERHPDNSIYAARRSTEGGWEEVEKVVDEPYTCKNPVLYVARTGILFLFYRIGPTAYSWGSAYRTSTDDGRTWNQPVVLPAGVYGPIKNKPIGLEDGRLLCPSSVENYAAKTSWMEIFDPLENTWSRHGPIQPVDAHFRSVSPADSEFTVGNKTYRLPHSRTEKGVIQPTVWRVAGNHYRALMRAGSDIGKICVTDSRDGGHTWSPARPTNLPNPNSGIDALNLTDGRLVLIYNHTAKGRNPLHLAVSRDDGETWSQPALIDTTEGQLSYPAVIQARDGTIHITYTWKRTSIAHLAMQPSELPPVD